MAAFTMDQVKEHADKVMALFRDGFQILDVFNLVPEIMKIVENIKGMTSEEKKEAFGLIADYVIDNTDVPWLPDALIDPLLKKGARLLAELLVSASHGEIVNRSE